ncbi:SDR family oxidoreductase [Anaerolineae bacterium CFX9]|jgi:NAD(P)-dependent dehydrogenase (short-subunit alcohol dehydrogenase family)|nr:SDR family oxidoreductase [Anaerolineae bacterium CFX9]
MAEKNAVVIIGGTSVFGKGVAAHYAAQGRPVYLTSRELERANEAAAEIGGATTGLALDLTRPHDIAAALAGIGTVDRLVLVSIYRDANSVRDYSVDGALSLVTLKLVGYTEVIHQLAGRMTPDASIVLYGGLAKDRPYPGSTTITTVNGGVMTMIHTLATELAPIRVNAVHPGIVGDSPYWANRPAGTLDPVIARTPLGRLVTVDEVVNATLFLLENTGVTGVNLRVDGGWMLK